MAQIFQETFEGTGYSRPGGWIEYAEGGNIIDEDYTTIPASLPFFGSQCLRVVISGSANNDAYAAKSFTPTSTCFVSGYVYIKTANWKINQTTGATLDLTDAASVACAYIQFACSANGARLWRYNYYSAGALQNSGWFGLDLETWYHFAFKYDVTAAMRTTCVVNGSIAVDTALSGGVKIPTNLIIGYLGAGATSAGSTEMLTDMVTADDADWVVTPTIEFSDVVQASDTPVQAVTKDVSDRIVAGRGNLIVNGTFELGGVTSGGIYVPTGWKNYNADSGELVLETTDVWSGKASMKFSSIDVSEGIVQVIPTSLVAGDPYDMGMMIKRGAENQWFNISLQYPSLALEGWNLKSGYTTWTAFDRSFVAQESGSCSMYLFHNVGLGIAGTHLIDNVYLVPSLTRTFTVTKRPVDIIKAGETDRKTVTKDIVEAVTLKEIEAKTVTQRVFDAIQGSDWLLWRQTWGRLKITDSIQMVESGTLTTWKVVGGTVWKPMKYTYNLLRGYVHNDWNVIDSLSTTWTKVASMVSSWTNNP